MTDHAGSDETEDTVKAKPKHDTRCRYRSLAYPTLLLVCTCGMTDADVAMPREVGGPT
jgi:hypothetical protein